MISLNYSLQPHSFTHASVLLLQLILPLLGSHIACMKEAFYFLLIYVQVWPTVQKQTYHSVYDWANVEMDPMKWKIFIYKYNINSV